VINFQVPEKAGNLLTSYVTISFSRIITLLCGVSYWQKFCLLIVTKNSQINQEKTKYMIVERKNSLNQNIIGHLKIKNYKFERVENLKYLGR